MKRLLIPVVLLLVTAFVFAGCSTATPSSTPSVAPAPATTAPAPVKSAPSTPAPAITTALPSPLATSPLAATTAPKSGGTMRWIAGIGPGTPFGIPWEAAGGAAFSMQFSLQGLVREQLGGVLKPILASSWDVVTDPANPSITYHLQKGVKFSDGTDFNAQAVQWNLQQDMTPGSTTVGSTTQWKSIDVIDDFNVRINLKTWQNTLIAGAGQLVYISPTAYKKNGEDWAKWNMVGTGPFTQTDFQRDVSLTFTKNTAYWEQGKPYLDGVKILYIADMMTSEALMKSGGAEVLDCQGQGKVAKDMQDAGFKLLTQPAGAVSSFAPDSLNPDSPWSKLEVRQAADYAIDKDGLAAAFSYGLGQAAYQLNGPTSLAYDPNLPPRKYNVDKAKQLLASAGYPSGFKTTGIIAPFGLNRDVVVAIQANLAKVGIQCDLQFPEAAQAMGMMMGTFPPNTIFYNPIMLFANPNSVFSFYLNEPPTGYKSVKHPPGWADLYTASLKTPKVDQVLAQKCQDAVYNDDTFIHLVNSASPFAVVNKLQDTGIGLQGSLTYHEPQSAWLSP